MAIICLHLWDIICPVIRGVSRVICYEACMCQQQKAKRDMGMSIKYEKKAQRPTSSCKCEKFCAYLPPMNNYVYIFSVIIL